MPFLLIFHGFLLCFYSVFSGFGRVESVFFLFVWRSERKFFLL